MGDPLIRHIRKLYLQALISLLAVIGAIISFGLMIVSLISHSYAAAAFGAVFFLCTSLAIYIDQRAKKYAKLAAKEPETISSYQNLPFDIADSILSGLTPQCNVLKLCEDAFFYRINGNLRIRVILYHTENFDKKSFDRTKNYVNQKVNTHYHISPWVSSYEAGKMMRLNIICTNSMNDALLKLLSINAAHNLRRTEGVINIAICGNILYFPPLFGACDLIEVRRYRAVIHFLTKHFCKTTKEEIV